MTKVLSSQRMKFPDIYLFANSVIAQRISTCHIQTLPGCGAGMSGDLTVSPNSFGVHRRNSIDSYVGFFVPLARVEDLTCST